MPSAIRQLLSQTSYNTDGSTTVWDFSFAGGYLEGAHVKAYTRNPLTGIITNLSLAPLGGDLVGPFQLRITPALVVGNELTIYRDTPKDVPLVNFADKASFSEAALDLNAKQAIFVAAESSDGLATALSSVAATAAYTVLAQSYANTAQAAATVATTQSGLAGGSATAAAASAVAANASALAAAASAASIAGGPVASFNGRFGVVTLSKADVTGTGLDKADIGLSNVDNTSDANKPVSTAQAAADAVVAATVPLPSNANPSDNGIAAQGMSTRYARQDHVHNSPSGGLPNLILNGNFNVNQRVYVSGAATAVANQYTLDRWRVVVAGQNVTFASSGNGNIVTAPAGGIEQPIEGAMINATTCSINWVGTATCTVNGTARAKGASFPTVVGTNCVVRFNNGTVSQVQVNAGTTVAPFEFRPLHIEGLLCKRYFNTQVQNVTIGSPGYGAGGGWMWFFPVTMRVAPTITISNIISGGTPTVIVATTDAVALGAAGNANGTIYCTAAANSEI